MTLPDPFTLRAVERRDLPAVHAIYAHHVLHGTASFEEIPPTLAEMIARHDALREKGYPYLVAEDAAGIIAGYAYAGPFRTRSAYRFLVEDSIYLAPGRERRGLGRRLLTALLADCEALGFRQMVAVIGDSANAPSISLHARLGFVHMGVLKATGFKFGRWLDTVLMQRPLGEGDDDASANGVAAG